MNRDTAEKYTPLGLLLLNGILSSVGSYSTFPLDIIAGLEGISILIAIVAAALGTILGLKKFRHRWLVLLGIGIVPALFTYTRILSQAGATHKEIQLCLFLYFYVFFAIFYILTHLEEVILHWRHVSGDAKSLPNQE